MLASPPDIRALVAILDDTRATLSAASTRVSKDCAGVSSVSVMTYSPASRRLLTASCPKQTIGDRLALAEPVGAAQCLKGVVLRLVDRRPRLSALCD